MVEMEACTNKCEAVAHYPDHVRRHIVAILQTGFVQKELLNGDDIRYYLEVGHMSPPLKKACEDKFLENLNASNCIDALDIAEQFKLLSLKKESIACLSDNFINLWNSEYFQLVSANILDDLCNMDMIAKHKDIFRALQKWLEFDHEKRLNEYLRLLDVIQQRRTNNNLKHCTKKYATYHAMLMSSVDKGKNTVATAVFNCDGEIVCHRKLFKSSDIKEDVSVTCVQRDESEAPYVYILSGKHVFRYDPIINKHVVCEQLCHSRSHASLVAHQNCVYAIGGQCDGKDVLEIEELDTKSKTKFTKKKLWKVLARVPENIRLHTAPCIDYNKNIYIIGERTNEQDPSTVVLVFSPDDKTVKVAAEFPKKCSDCEATLYESDIYISSSEGIFLKFDTKTNIFTSCTDLPVLPGKDTGLYCERDKIYMLGRGSHKTNDTLTKYEYDTQTNSWKSVGHLNMHLNIKGICDIFVPSDTNMVPFYDINYKEIM